MKAVITFMLGLTLGFAFSPAPNNDYLRINQGKKTFGVTNELRGTMYWLEMHEHYVSTESSSNLRLIGHVTSDEFDCPLAFHIQPYVSVQKKGTGYLIELCAEAGKKIEVAIKGIHGQLIHGFTFKVGEPGVYRFFWDGTSGSGGRLTNGAYLMTVLTGGETLSCKFVILS